MEPKKKIIIALLVVIVLVFSIIFLFMILKKDNVIKSGKLVWWGYEEKSDGIEYLVGEYTKSNSNVSIEYVQKGNSPEDYEKIVNDALAAGTGPDIYEVRNDWIPKHYQKLAAVPSDIYTKQTYENDFFGTVAKDLVYKDTVYAIPTTVDNLAVFFNPDVMKSSRPGDTWETFKEAVKNRRVLTGDFVNVASAALGTSNNVSYAEDILSLIMLQNHTTMTSEDNSKAYFNLSAKDKYGNLVYPGTSALSFYTSFADPTKETYTWRSELANSIVNFTDGKVGMIFGYASDIQKIKKMTSGKINFSVFKAPQVLGNTVNYSKYWAHGVSKNSGNQTVAFDFLKFANGTSVNETYVNKVEMPSALKDIAKKQKRIEKVSVFVEQAESSTSWFKGNWFATENVFKEMINAVAILKQPSQAAIDAAAKKMEDVYKEF